MVTLESMQAKIKKLEQQAGALIAKQSSGVIEKIRKLMAEHGLTVADIDGHVGGKRRAKKAAVTSATPVARYRDPKSGAMWSGHGRAPQWIANAKNRDKFLVDASTATGKPASATKAKTAGNYRRGPQPAMYRDPKSGATWTGHGRAPAWIAEAKNRDRFLISGTSDATVAATASAAGVASTAKTVGKKAAPKTVGATAGKGQRKGPQPALYLDPKSGATWSGRGRAPAWLVSVKDRSKFLIDGTSAAADAGAVSKPTATTKKVVATKATLTKKPAAKKTTAKKAVSAKAPAKKAAAKNAVPAAVKKAPRKSVAVPAPVATVESGAELTT